MKTTICVFIIAMSLTTHAQKIGAGASFGISSKSKPQAELTIGLHLAKKLVFYPVAIKAHITTDASCPVIIEPRMAYKLGQWEVYGGYGYYITDFDGKAQFKKLSGFKTGFGIIKRLGLLFFTAASSGRILTLGIGIYGSH